MLCWFFLPLLPTLRKSIASRSLMQAALLIHSSFRMPCLSSTISGWNRNSSIHDQANRESQTCEGRHSQESPDIWGKPPAWKRITGELRPEGGGRINIKREIPGNEIIIYMHSRVGYYEIRAVTLKKKNKNNFKNIAPNLRHVSIINNIILKFKNLQSIKYKVKNRINELDFKPESILIQC